MHKKKIIVAVVLILLIIGALKKCSVKFAPNKITFDFKQENHNDYCSRFAPLEEKTTYRLYQIGAFPGEGKIRSLLKTSSDLYVGIGPLEKDSDKADRIFIDSLEDYKSVEAKLRKEKKLQPRGGVFQLPSGTKKWKPLQTGFPHPPVFVHESVQGITTAEGLVVYPRLTTVSHLTQFDSKIFAGTEDGLFKFIPENEQWEEEGLLCCNGQGNKGPAIEKLLSPNENQLIAASGSLFLLQRGKDKWQGLIANVLSDDDAAYLFEGEGYIYGFFRKEKVENGTTSHNPYVLHVLSVNGGNGVWLPSDLEISEINRTPVVFNEELYTFTSEKGILKIKIGNTINQISSIPDRFSYMGLKGSDINYFFPHQESLYAYSNRCIFVLHKDSSQWHTLNIPDASSIEGKIKAFTAEDSFFIGTDEGFVYELDKEL